MQDTEKQSLITVIQNRIIAGVFIVIPVGITLWLAIMFFHLITRLFDPVIVNLNFSSEENQWFMFVMRGVSLLVALVFLFLVGQIAKWTIGRRLMLTIEKILLEIPMISTIYSTAKQVVDAMKGSQGGLFKQVVLVEYPRKGTYAMGFVTNENKSANEMAERTQKDLICVFMPFVPPTAGNLIFVPREECINLQMSVKDGMKLIISGGVAAPEYPYKVKNPDTGKILKDGN